MLNTDISKELKLAIEANQAQLVAAIHQHQLIYFELQKCEHYSKKELEEKLLTAEEKVIKAGIEQKALLDRLRIEFEHFKGNLKSTTQKNGIEEKRTNLAIALNRAKKQQTSRSSTVTSSSSTPSEESELASGPPTPEPEPPRHLLPQDLPQPEFLGLFGLVTHEQAREIQAKRLERKRRSTANPQFVHSSARQQAAERRKRSNYLISAVSPPNTRQSAKKRVPSRPNSPQVDAKRPAVFVGPSTSAYVPVASPSGLSYDKVILSRLDSDNSVCVECKTDEDTLHICEICHNGFHDSCFTRPQPLKLRYCPRCYRDYRLTDAPHVLSLVNDFVQRINRKQELQERQKLNIASMTQLQNEHSQRVISLKKQENERVQLHAEQQQLQENIDKVHSFIAQFREGDVEIVPRHKLEEVVEMEVSSEVVVVSESV